MKTLYMQDSYLKEFTTKIKKAEQKNIILEETAFYPSSGGQPNDKGEIKTSNETYQVINVYKKDNQIIHEVDREGLREGDEIQGIINWERRYALMKAHTATHIICSILHKELGSLITGNQLQEDYFRIDFNLEKYDKEILEQVIIKANKIITENKKITTYHVPKEEAYKIPGALKLANILPPDIDELRIVEIENTDTQVDGGTHVKNTQEIGTLKLIKTENKGKNNRRAVIKIEQQQI